MEKHFISAATCYTSYNGTWVERTISLTPENSSNGETATLFKLHDFYDNGKDIVIHAPVNFGLTCLGRKLALNIFKENSKNFHLFIRKEFQPHDGSVEEALKAEVNKYKISLDNVAGIILDYAAYDKSTRRTIASIRKLNPAWRIVALCSRDDMVDLGIVGQKEVFPDFESFHLWSLSRQDVRELVSKCVSEKHILNEDVLTDKIVADLDALNIHRSPLNCLTLLKINENQIDDTPVNRTDMIERVLSLFFNQFNQIPQYSERPDLVDCKSALGYFSEILIKRTKYTFTKSDFLFEISAFAKRQKLPLESDVLFLFLASERILVKRNNYFEFRFAYWLHYFAAHRMLHCEEFCKFILHEGRYVMFPEILEFYSGIDRRRTDAVSITIKDLKRVNKAFTERSGISTDFDPFSAAIWRPSGDYIEELTEEVQEEAQNTNLSQELKDSIADKTYDRSKAYRQEVQAFIKESTLPELFQAVKAAARTLRNSDYVDPILKEELLIEVLDGWKKVSQALLIIAPILARDGRANFEGMGFVLMDFDEIPDDEKVHAIVRAIPQNVVAWFEQDIHSKKLGPLIIEYVDKNEDRLSGMLLRRIVINHKPTGWIDSINKFISNESKDTFYLLDCFVNLRVGYRHGEGSEIMQFKRLAAKALAKHSLGVLRPNKKLVNKALKLMEDQDNSSK